MTKKIVESKNEVVTPYKGDVDGDGVPDSVAPGGPPSSNKVRGVYGMRVARRIKEANEKFGKSTLYKLIDKETHQIKHEGSAKAMRRLQKKNPGHYIGLTTKKVGEYFKEEAPTVNAGSGNIAGIGVGPKGEPGISKANQKKHGKNVLRRAPPQALPMGTFWGQKTFIVPDRMVNEVRMQKRKGKWWVNYLGEEDEISQAIREYANANPCEPIILEGENYGHIVFARYGK